jgi:hypothetical protein
MRLRLIIDERDRSAWFVDSQGQKRFKMTDLIQPEHPIIREIAEGKTVEQIAEYWRDQFSYDDNPPFRLLAQYVLECPDDFTPSKLIEHIARTKKADCWGGSTFVASLMISQGYEASVVLGDMVSIHDERFRWPHAWVSVSVPTEDKPISVNIFQSGEKNK